MPKKTTTLHTPKKIKTKTSRKITKNILIADLVSKYPKTVKALMKHGFHCIGCVMSPYETLEMGAKAHGISLEPLLKEINEVIEK